MDSENSTPETTQQQMTGESGTAGASAQSIQERGAEVLGQAEQAVSEAYDKTARAVNETYEQAKCYTSTHPHQTMLIALGVGVGIGVGMGFIWGASARRLGTGRFARPVVNALSDIALEFFR